MAWLSRDFDVGWKRPIAEKRHGTEQYGTARWLPLHQHFATVPCKRSQRATAVQRKRNGNFFWPLLSVFTIQEHLHVYAYSNEIHKVGTNVLLTQQLFTVLFFLIKFKTLGSTFEPGLATKLCPRPCLVNDGSFFEMSCHQKLLGQGFPTRSFSPMWGANVHFFHER